MNWLCCHGSAIWNGPLPTGRSPKLSGSASAPGGTGARLGSAIDAANSANGCCSSTRRVLASTAWSPASGTPVSWDSAKPRIGLSL